MIVRCPNKLRSIPTSILPIIQQARNLHLHKDPPKIPQSTPFVPDHTTFLTLIGRDLSKHASKIQNWSALFSLTSPQLRELGIEPARNRRYLLRWREKFRNGIYGIGGNLKEVKDGVAELRVVEKLLKGKTVAQTEAEAVAKIEEELQAGTETFALRRDKVIVNVPQGSDMSSVLLEDIQPVKGLKIYGAHTIKGSHVLPLKGMEGRGAKVVVKEGLWEDKRGKKIDGGERRRAEVRAKRRAAERRAARS